MPTLRPTPVSLVALFVLCSAACLYAADTPVTPPWLQLPPTPTLPASSQSGLAPINGIKIWYAVFGKGDPVILLHGGLAHASYWGLQVPVLAKNHQVIVMDSRGHGRSSRNDEPFGYHLMASDVVALMDFLKIEKAAIVGWSDGGIIGLDLAIHYPQRLTRLFAFAANSDPTGVKDTSQNPTFTAYIARAEAEYQKLSPTPDQFKAFLDQIIKMWETQPNYTAAQLQGIKTPTWIVDGDHDEAITRANTLFMADHIPAAGLLIQPLVSHFSFLQDPQQFNDDLVRFLDSPRVP